MARPAGHFCLNYYLSFGGGEDVFAPVIVEFFLLCVVCEQMSVAAHVGAKEKQRHFSIVYVWHSTKPGSCHFCILFSAEPAIRSYSQRLECIKMRNILN